MTASQAYVAFNLTDKVGPATLAKLVAAHGDVVSAWEAYPNKISRTGAPVDWEAEVKSAERRGITIVTPADADYPERLRSVPGSPLALYVKGSVSSLSRPSVAIVGTRHPTEYGVSIAKRLASDFVTSGMSVVSGLALGIDAAAHTGAISAGGTTVGVLGGGIDRFYPEENRALARDMIRSGGAVASQFPLTRPVDQQTFPIRNHVVAALASAVVVVEAPSRSGALITAEIAVDLGRAVLAIPGRIDSPASAGCLRLIRDGATLARNADDVLEAISVLLPKKAAIEALKSSNLPKYSVEEALIMMNVDENGTSLDDIVVKTKLPVEKVNSLAMALRMKGFVKFLPGNRIGPTNRPV